MKTIENNKLIAEFMGLSIKEGVCYYTDEDDMFPMGIEVEEPYLPYDDSWDWLMPVLKKIDSYANEVMSIDEFDNYRSSYKMISSPTHYEIDYVHTQAVEFIKWYNEQDEKNWNVMGSFDENGDTI